MNQFIPLIAGVVVLAIGSVLGYFTRQSIAKQRLGTIEQKLQQKLDQTRKEAEKIIVEAKEKAIQTAEKSKNDEEQRRKSLLQAENLLIKREANLDERRAMFEDKEDKFSQKVGQLREMKEKIENLGKQALENIERISHLSQEEAKKEMFSSIEKEFQKDILERIKKLEMEGIEKYEKKAKEVLASAIQKVAISQAQEITTTTIILPSEDLKGKIIGKEGRNIRSLERAAGVEIIVDEAPETVVISGFDPVRRHVAKIALENLIKDGRIHPTRVKEEVEEYVVNKVLNDNN